MKTFGGDSGSETELYLGPTATAVRSKGWYSWCVLLYMVLLTVLILLLCVFMAFMAYTMKVIADNCSSMDDRLGVVKNDLKSLKDTKSYSGKGFDTELRRLNHTLLRLESTYELSHQQMELSMEGVVNRLAVLEVNRQGGQANSEIEQLYKMVVNLNSNMSQLLGPSGDIQSIFKSLDSITTAINSYDFQLRNLHRDHGDLSSNQAALSAAVDGVKGGLSDLKVELNAVRDSALERHKVMYQSVQLLASQLDQLQTAVGVLNQSLGLATVPAPSASVHQIFSTEVSPPITSIWQSTLKPDHNIPSTGTSFLSLPSTSSLSPLFNPPQPTPSLTGNVSVSIPGGSGSLTSVPAQPRQTPVPTPYTSSITNTTGATPTAENGTETTNNSSSTPKISQSSVPSSSGDGATTLAVSDWETTFNMTDANRDGKLSKQELDSVFGTDGDTLFPILDKNDDHYITQDEMKDAFKEGRSS